MDDFKQGFIGVAEAASQLGVTTRTVLRYIERGQLTATKIGTGKTASFILNRQEIDAMVGERNA